MILSRLQTILGIALTLAAAVALADDIKITLSGAQENPPVATSASGSGVITINADGTVSGSITTAGVPSTAAHIHVGATGTNGPVIVPLTRAGENGWAVAPGAKLNEAQMVSYKAGNLYVNVHSKANPGGEIRGQIKP